MTTVKHEEYWPAILADPTIYGQIQTADAAWNARAACVFEVLKNTLCARDNAILTQQWENTLELSPADGATLNERKAVILYRLTEAPPLTIALLEKSLILLMGEGKAVVEHLPAENKLVVHTDRADDTQLEAVTALLERVLPKNVNIERYNHHIEVSWHDLSRYSACKNVNEINAVAQAHGFSSYKEDLTSDGWWIYPLDSIAGVSLSGFFGNYQASQASTKIRHAYLYLPKVNSNFVGASLVSNCKNLEYVYLYAPGLWTNCQELAKGCTKLTFFEAYVPNIYRINDWCAGCTSLSHFRFLAPLKEGGLAGGGYAARIWDGCVLDVASVQNIAENMPTMTDLTTTTIGIDEAFQNDAAMLEALALLDSKNWNIELQTNQSPTSAASSTYSLRGKTIYAKVVEIDGVRELCWGHYVAHPEGYEEFRSIEAAREYFGLPAEDEAITE